VEEPCHADVLVVGGGPAGCATALTLLPTGRSVVVVDPGGRARAGVGEVLPPAAWPLLERLELTEPFRAQHHLPARVLRCRWGAGPPYEIDLALHPYGGGWHLDRGRFDAMLRGAVRARGGAVVRGAVRRVERGRGGWRVDRGARSEPVHARVLVDASGRARVVARRMGAVRSALDSLVGLVAIGPTAVPAGPVCVTTLIEADDAGWWYAGRLPGRRMVAAYLTDPDLLPAGRDRLPAFFGAGLARTALVAEEWTDVVGPASLRVAPAGTSRVTSPAGPGWLAVGDAAMAMDPLSGHGVVAALRSGVEGGAVADRMLAGDAAAHLNHVRALDEEYRAQMGLRAHYYGQASRRTPFWQRRCP
jgi:flavin-dependent dehydrogenase